MKTKWMAMLTSSVIGMSLLTTTAWGAAYTVEPGDSLWKISMKQGITIDQLRKSNSLNTDMIMPGQVLQISSGDSYIVQLNETLWTISQKFGISLDNLIAANPQLSNPSNIWSGLIINLPESKPTVLASSKPQKLSDGFFPLAQGTYQPFTNNYGDERYWNGSGYSQRQHEGQDIFAEKGTPIYNAMAGEVINIGWNQLGGWRLTIRVDASTVFYYAHMSGYGPGLAKGTQVKKGQLIGYVGSTGYGPEGTHDQFVPHLHFGIYRTEASSWAAIDPNVYLRWWEQ